MECDWSELQVMKRRRSLIFSWVLLSSLSQAIPAAAGADEKPVRLSELLVFGQRVSAKTSIGIHIVLERGWYLYWVNPGDAGLAPEVRWRLPAGFAAGVLRYPVPEKIRHDDVVVYAYHNEILIQSEITAARPPAAGEKVTFSAVLDWMACKESCLVGKESLAVSPVDLKPEDIKRAEDIRARFAARFPRAADPDLLDSAEAKLAKSAGGWTLEIAFSKKLASRVRDFYPAPIENFVIDNSRIVVSEGKITIPLTPSGTAAALREISGLVIVDSFGYEVRLPVKL
jgi:thiol:disulfide interchange protein DsbD